MPLVWVTIALYISFQIAVGLWASRRIHNEKDYLLAGRSLGVGLLTVALFSNWFGAETVIGSSAAVAEQGLSGSRADPFGYTITLIGIAFFLSAQLRAKNYVTLADFFRNRYSEGTEKLAVLILIPTSLMWSAAQLMAFGHILSVVTHIAIEPALMVATLLVIIYTFLGGLLGNVMIGLVQAVILILGLGLLLLFVLNASGGFSAAVQSIDAGQLSFIGEGETWLMRLNVWMIPILGGFVSQEAISRILAAKSPETARKASFLASLLYFSVGIIPIFIALIAHHFNLPLNHRDEFLPVLAQTLMPPLPLAIFISALLSSILSTVNGTLLTASSLLSHNLIVPLFPHLKESKKVLSARFMVILCGVAAYFIATSGKTIFDMVQAASSFGSAGILITTLLGLRFHIGGKYTAYITLITGVAVTMIGNYLIESKITFLCSLLFCLSTFLTGGFIENQLKKKTKGPRYQKK